MPVETRWNKRGSYSQKLLDRDSKRSEFKRIAVMEEIKWKPKAKAHSLKGDNNTRLFH